MDRVCDYCESKYDDSLGVCPYCGAPNNYRQDKIKEKKDNKDVIKISLSLLSINILTLAISEAINPNGLWCFFVLSIDMLYIFAMVKMKSKKSKTRALIITGIFAVCFFLLGLVFP